METNLLNYKGLSGRWIFLKDEAPIKNQPLYFAWTLEIEHIPFLLKLPTSLCSRTRPWVLFFRSRGLDDATDFPLFLGPFEDEMRSLDLFLTILTTGRDFWSMFSEVEARNFALFLDHFKIETRPPRTSDLSYTFVCSSDVMLFQIVSFAPFLINVVLAFFALLPDRLDIFNHSLGLLV